MTRGTGFTLIELLVALAVFALMSVMAYSGLASVLEARNTVNQTLENTARIQRAIYRIRMDLQQTVARPIRDRLGRPQPAMLAWPQRGLAFTRAGWRNPLGMPRGHLQRVAYRVDEKGRLVRLHWRFLDRARSSKPMKRVLLKHVKNLDWRFLNRAREWVDVWPPDAAAGGGTRRRRLGARTRLPRAMELRLETAAWGELRFLFVIPGAAP